MVAKGSVLLLGHWGLDRETVRIQDFSCPAAAGGSLCIFYTAFT
jgi:hypothetical protein